MPELPSGTVIFLFINSQGSTRHELAPESYADALAGHRRFLHRRGTA